MGIDRCNRCDKPFEPMEIQKVFMGGVYHNSCGEVVRQATRKIPNTCDRCAKSLRDAGWGVQGDTGTYCDGCATVVRDRMYDAARTAQMDLPSRVAFTPSEEIGLRQWAIRAHEFLWKCWDDLESDEAHRLLADYPVGSKSNSTRLMPGKEVVG